MSRAATSPADPAPTAHSTNRDPDTRGISPRPYSFIRPMPVLPERWRSPQDQDKLLNEYLSHDGYLATFASSRGLTIDQLYDWLHSEPITARRKRLSDMAQERADLLACLARPAAIDTLLRMVTQGSLNHNQTRLAASAILRAAAAADRRSQQRTPSVSERAAHDLPSPTAPATSIPTPTPPAPRPSDVAMWPCENVAMSTTPAPRKVSPAAPAVLAAFTPAPNRARSGKKTDNRPCPRPLALTGPATPRSSPSRLPTSSRIPLELTPQGHSHPNGARSIQRYEPRRA